MTLKLKSDPFRDYYARLFNTPDGRVVLAHLRQVVRSRMQGPSETNGYSAAYNVGQVQLINLIENFALELDQQYKDIVSAKPTTIR